MSLFIQISNKYRYFYFISFICLLFFSITSCQQTSEQQNHIILKEYTVSFETNGGTIIEPIRVTENTYIQRPASPNKVGYSFDDWYIDKKTTIKFDFEKPITSNLILYAKWNKNFMISFETYGGTIIPSIILRENSFIKKPKDPEKEGFIFINWYMDDSFTKRFDFNTKITADIQLYARYVLQVDNLIISSLEEIENKLTNKNIDINKIYTILITDEEPDLTELSTVLNRFHIYYTLDLSNTSIKRLSYSWDKGLYGSKRMKKIILPLNLVYIGDHQLSGCQSLEEVILPNTVKILDGMVFQSDSKLSKIILPDSIEEINGRMCFYGCKNLKEINIPFNLRETGQEMFYECDSLLDVSFSENLNIINMSTFYGCKNLINITLPDSVIEIKSYAFSDCTKLESLQLSKNLKKIGWGCFDYCKSLTELYIPESVDYIEPQKIYTCKALTLITFGNANNWYVVKNKLEAEDKVNGEFIDFSKPENNVELINKYQDFYFYRK